MTFCTYLVYLQFFVLNLDTLVIPSSKVQITGLVLIYCSAWFLCQIFSLGEKKVNVQIDIHQGKLFYICMMCMYKSIRMYVYG